MLLLWWLLLYIVIIPYSLINILDILYGLKLFGLLSLLLYSWGVAIPSFKLLYSLDEIINPLLTVKAIGNQWFWSYEINDIDGLNLQFDSYAKSIDDLSDGEFRLLDVDNILYLPVNIPIRLLTTSVDVIHSFTVPSLGLKIDAIPGRINHALIYLFNTGKSFGQCSELCGSSHFNMPISIFGVNSSQFFNWLLSF